jgi:2-polyprenyl-3-methyl-5-hydroxy-6-metoxy-1,4-benzoquinol methylase
MSQTHTIGPTAYPTDFWDRLYSHDPAYSAETNAERNQALKDAVAYFGDLNGKTVVDIGCGIGDTTIAFARCGARVIAVDTSAAGIEALKARCSKEGVDKSVEAVVCDAMAIDTLGEVDFVFGSMILHHLEPFERFPPALRKVLKAGGKAFFWENNAASDLLIWFRTHVVGKLWVPKYGDPHEFPLTPAEVGLIRKELDVDVVYPRMIFFTLVSEYLLRGRVRAPFAALDSWLFKKKLLTRYSYRQYLYIRKAQATALPRAA